MDSPEMKASSSVSPAKVQDSPFFNYLETLSPIELNKEQRFSEYTFPHPPPLFSSPRTNPPQDASFLRRLEFPCSSDVAFYGEVDEKAKILVRDVDISGSSIPLSELKDHGDEGSKQAQAFSPTAAIDELLTDSIEASFNTANLHVLNLKKDTSIVQASLNGRNITVDDQKEKQADVAENFITLVQNEVDPKNEISVCVKSGYTENAGGREVIDGVKINEDPALINEKIDDPIETGASRQTDPTKSYDPHIENTTATCSASSMYKDTHFDIMEWCKELLSDHSGVGNHPSRDVNPQNSRNGLGIKQDCATHCLPESSQNAQTDKNFSENAKNYGGVTESNMRYDNEESNLHQRANIHKRLHSVAGEVYMTSSESENIAVNAFSHASPIDFEPSNPCQLNERLNKSTQYTFQQLSTRASCTYKTPKASSDKVDGYAQKKGKSSFAAPRPSGIGLHLNTIGNATVINYGGIMHSAENENMGSKGTKLPSAIEHPLLEGSKSCSVSVNVVDNLSVKPTLAAACSLACTENTKEDYKDTQEMVLVNSSAGFSTSANAPLNIEPLSVGPCVTPFDMKNPTSQGPCRFEEANQLSPRRKRKKNVAEDDGCKHCSCKKSKCLKLYCDCFAAKRYCSETCICKDCLNKPEYEKFVFNSRQKIESRNPTAFAPKIVQLVTESPQKSGETNKHRTSASARHKRGCYCKKSMCLKKYCECFEANVGCSNGCRCDNCKNTFGSRKGSERISKVDDRKAEDEEYEKDISDENVDTVNISDATRQRKPSLFSPMTPLVPCSNNRSDLLPKSQIYTRRYLSSPQFSASAISLHKKSPISTRSSTGTKRIVKLGEGGASLLPHDLELDERGNKKENKSSSGWDGIGDICQVNTLSHPSVETPTSKPGIVRMPRAPVRWRCSPGTPMPQFGGSKFVPDSVSGIYSIPENDTPDMMKDAQTPIKTVKISSPKQKRVSSPKIFHGLSSLSYSPGLRTSRKLVLQSMPSLTSDSEGSEGSEKDDAGKD